MDLPHKKKFSGGRILIAGDNKMMREGLRALIEEKLGYECIAGADDDYAAVSQCKELKPDFVIMDIGLPNLTSIETIHQIKAHRPEIEVVVLSMHATRNNIVQALQAGASAYLLKDSAFEDLAAALVAVGKGRMYLSPIISTAALKNETVGISERTRRLTNRELQVLHLIAECHSAKEIAAILEISIKTIETHRKQIMDKLDIRTIAGLTKYCIREGLTSL